MLINKYLEKRDAEKLKREKEEKARQQQLEREREARQLRLSARENLYQQRVNAGTANAFERRIAAGGGFKNFKPEEIAADLEKHKNQLTDQNMLDGQDAIIQSTEQTARDNVKEGGPSYVLTGATFEREMVQKGGKGNHNMHKLENLDVNTTGVKTGFWSDDDKKWHWYFSPYDMIHKVKEVGGIANLEASFPNSVKNFNASEWIPKAKTFLTNLLTNLHELTKDSRRFNFKTIPGTISRYYRAIQKALAAVENFEAHHNASKKKTQTQNLIAATQDMGFRKIPVKSINKDGTERVDELDYKTLVQRVKSANAGISETAARDHVDYLVGLNGQIDESQLRVPQGKSNQANGTQSVPPGAYPRKHIFQPVQSVPPEVYSEEDWVLQQYQQQIDEFSKKYKIGSLIRPPKVNLGFIETAVPRYDITPHTGNGSR